MEHFNVLIICSFGNPFGAGVSVLKPSDCTSSCSPVFSASLQSAVASAAFCLLLSGCSSFGTHPVAFGWAREGMSLAPASSCFALGERGGDFNLALSSSSTNAADWLSLLQFQLPACLPSTVSSLVHFAWHPRMLGELLLLL